VCVTFTRTGFDINARAGSDRNRNDQSDINADTHADTDIDVSRHPNEHRRANAHAYTSAPTRCSLEARSNANGRRCGDAREYGRRMCDGVV